MACIKAVIYGKYYVVPVAVSNKYYFLKRLKIKTKPAYDLLIYHA